ncbi:Eukaryotic translation initiation factor 4 gamma 3 [Amphibalanus amphitrite]|uniref:Eukaryotic translation initiation factor 4 gamma 3 n=1 Tax=Amphibalanus amphitrite TaxID=1232801 RepID=A0A6A4WTW5_AMPAM|nr:Eukaryotic translation initiation factor 4 gamma 3 [Amphibalanus amphitrite]
MLPLVSTIPSIGPHPPALFGAFFEKLEEQYDSAEQEPFRRLDLLMPWLSGQDSIEAALEENELQDVYKTVLSVNEVLDQPLQQLDVVDTIHVPMTMLFGFASYVRELTGLINKLTGENAPRLLEKMRHVSVQTEYGLYALVDVVFRAVLKMPRLVDICADACAVLDKLQVKSDRADGTAVSFGDFMLTRLSRGLAPVNRNTLSREDLLHHLETVEDPAERRRQLRELTDCWRQAERRRCVCLLLLAALIRRNLVRAPG